MYGRAKTPDGVSLVVMRAFRPALFAGRFSSTAFLSMRKWEVEVKIETAGLIAWIVGSIVALSYALAPSLWTVANVLNLLTALATTAAAIVALVIANASQKEKNADALKMAHLIAAGITHEIHDFKLKLVSLHLKLLNRETEPTTQKELERVRVNQSAKILRLDIVLKHPVVSYEVATFSSLIPLEKNVAGHLHSVCTAAKSIQRECSGSILEKWEVLNHETRENWLIQWSARIGAILMYMDLIDNEIIKAANIGSPPKTLEELFNSPIIF